MNALPIQRALLSVSNKEGIVPFAKQLHELGIELLSTGGTSQILREANIPVIDVSSHTGFPEIMDGRVKTLHPKIHGGILGKRQEHADIANQHEIDWIDLVVVNLYPFAETIQKPNTTSAEAIEMIDIGGPAMIRAAAKNMEYVTVVVDPLDYDNILQALSSKRHLEHAYRQTLAAKAFAHTANYDAHIAEYLSSRTHPEDPVFPDQRFLILNKVCSLRYGENPDQKACAYRLEGSAPGVLLAEQLQGKELSYNNLFDADATIAAVHEFEKPSCVIVKHANPCGIASSVTIAEAFSKALETDTTSAFGGIIALNRPCDKATAAMIVPLFFEVLIAPDFSEEALALLSTKSNLRVLKMTPSQTSSDWEYRFIEGGFLMQERLKASLSMSSLKTVTEKTPSQKDMEDLLFAWRGVKHVKSNGILIAKHDQAVGIGAGQVSRIDAVNIAINKAGDKLPGSVLASDAFFPFRDNIDQIASAGIRAIIQPGGSLRDQEVIDACNQHGIAMVMSGVRCFKH